MNKKTLLPVTAAAFALWVATPATATVTVLTFDGNICNNGDPCNDGSNIDQSYGDSIGADVGYRSIATATNTTHDPFLRHWNGNYGDLTKVVWGGADGVSYKSEITFTALAGYEVSLIGFDAACYLNRSTCQLLNYDIRSASGGAIAAGSTSTNFPGHASLVVNSAYYSNGIVLQWGPDGYDVGLDNIAFDVRLTQAGAVPEPASWALMIAGFGLVGSAMRKTKGRQRAIVSAA